MLVKLRATRPERSRLSGVGRNGAARPIRTDDLPLTRRLLYRAELTRPRWIVAVRSRGDQWLAATGDRMYGSPRAAGVVELVDAPDSKSGSERSVGSIPTTRTTLFS